MYCHLNLNPLLEYPTNFPATVDLSNAVDPYEQTSLQELSKRAFQVGLPYFTFAVATIPTVNNHIQSINYSYYDAINYRLNKLNKLPTANSDPSSRLPINQVNFFAIENSSNPEDEIVHAYPYPFYFDLPPQLSSIAENFEEYAFSALNYHAIEEGNPLKIETLRKIHRNLMGVFDYKIEATNDVHIKTIFMLEQKKWSKINYSSSLTSKKSA